ncbi:MAG: hypothetical protein ACI33N_00275 [Desulfovibrionaceae bacterium]
MFMTPWASCFLAFFLFGTEDGNLHGTPEDGRQSHRSGMGIDSMRLLRLLCVETLCALHENLELECGLYKKDKYFRPVISARGKEVVAMVLSSKFNRIALQFRIPAGSAVRFGTGSRIWQDNMLEIFEKWRWLIQ